MNVTHAAPGFTTLTVTHSVVTPMVEIFPPLITPIITAAPDQNFTVGVEPADGWGVPLTPRLFYPHSPSHLSHGSSGK